MRIVLPVLAVTAMVLAGGGATAGGKPDLPLSPSFEIGGIANNPATTGGKVPADTSAAERPAPAAGRLIGELRAILPEVTKKLFHAVDVDGDGLVSPDEIEAAQASGLIRS